MSILQESLTGSVLHKWPRAAESFNTLQDSNPCSLLTATSLTTKP